ncbi:MAG: DUF3570 domain-containing protein [Bacteroidales bacterium]|nr:DUF3570 domain-containing protein [Bacteroidales bacterium]
MEEKQEGDVAAIKRLKSLLVIFLFILSANILFAQVEKDTSTYQTRKIKKVEADLIMSYYSQEGYHSAVTGGVGTEQLTDLATNIEINLLVDGIKEGNENSINLKVGIDAYSSASSDNINPETISSASSGDVRVYPAISYTHLNRLRHYSMGGSLSLSTEYDYKSLGIGGSFSKFSSDENRDFSFSWQSFFDTWKVIYPYELRPPGYPAGNEDDEGVDTKPRNSHSVSLVYSQVLSKRFQASLLSDGIYQAGLLSTPFHRTAFKDTIMVEKLPDKRFKYPIGLRLNYFFSDFFIARFYYRYYQDSWGISAHTFSLELPIKIKPWFSVYPSYRFYSQQAMDYFYFSESSYMVQDYYSNDYDLSEFTSHFAGIGLRFAPPSGVINWKRISTKLAELNLRYGYYSRTDGLNSNIISVHLKLISL